MMSDKIRPEKSDREPESYLAIATRELNKRLRESGCTVEEVGPSLTGFTATFVPRSGPTEEVELSPHILNALKESGIGLSPAARMVLSFTQRRGRMVLTEELWEKVYALLPTAPGGKPAPPPLTGLRRDASDQQKYDRLVEQIIWADRYGGIVKVAGRLMGLWDDEYERFDPADPQSKMTTRELIESIFSKKGVALLDYFQGNNWRYPQFEEWLAMWGLLPEVGNGNSRRPRSPASSFQASADDKAALLIEHLMYADKHGVIDHVDQYLRQLTPEQWVSKLSQEEPKTGEFNRRRYELLSTTAEILSFPQTSKMGKLPRRRKNKEVRSREFLTQDEVEALMKAASASGRHGHRDTTLILLAYRHGLRVSELVCLRWDQIDMKVGLMHVNRRKNGTPSTHPIRGPEIRALRRLQRDYPDTQYVFASERKGPMTTSNVRKMIARAGQDARLSFPVHPHMLRHACGFKLANDGHDTRAVQHYLGHKSIQHTVRYTELASGRFNQFWED